jgi:hypothetical protein
MGVRHGEVHRCFGASGGVSSGGVLDDLHVDAEGGGVLGEVLAVAAVDPDLADRVAGVALSSGAS